MAKQRAKPRKVYRRFDFFVEIVEQYGLTSYLEIGCDGNMTFAKLRRLGIDVVGIDPRRGGTHRMTSDEYFEQCDRTFDLVLVDGLHHSDQVLRDVENSLAHLNVGGLILMHDALPGSARSMTVPQPETLKMWCGDVWRAIVVLRQRPDLDVYTADFDSGCGIVLKAPSTDCLKTLYTVASPELTYEFYRDNGDWLLRVVSLDHIKLVVADYMKRWRQ